MGPPVFPPTAQARVVGSSGPSVSSHSHVRGSRRQEVALWRAGVSASVLRTGGQGWATRAAGSGDSTDEPKGRRRQCRPGVRCGDKVPAENERIRGGRRQAARKTPCRILACDRTWQTLSLTVRVLRSSRTPRALLPGTTCSRPWPTANKQRMLTLLRYLLCVFVISRTTAADRTLGEGSGEVIVWLLWRAGSCEGWSRRASWRR